MIKEEVPMARVTLQRFVQELDKLKQ